LAHTALLLFGLVSSAALIAFGGAQALRRRYRDRFGVVRAVAPAVRAGLLVAFIGMCELAVTAFLYLAGR
jgi:hypothetical protein